MIAVTIQEEQPFHVLQTIFFGFSLEEQSPLLTILHGGGVVSMLKPSLVIFAACALAGVLEGISVFSGIKHLLLNMKLKRHTRYGLTTFISTMNAAFGCSQAIAVVMTDEIMRDCYKKEENYQFALDIENSCILTSALIPWNIAALICTTTLNVSMYGFVPYAFYLYIFPFVYFFYCWYKENRLSKELQTLKKVG